MIKNRIFRRIALIVSLVMLLTSTVNTAYGFIVTKSDSIINIFRPTEGMAANLLIGKTVEHPLGEAYVIPANISFDFRVDLGSYYANATIETSGGTVEADENGSITVSVKPGQDFTVENIEAGTKVTVTELRTYGPGFSAKDGVLVREGVVGQDGSLRLDFVNIYAPAAVQFTNATVVGVKELEGRPWQEGDTFSFALEQETSEGVWTLLGTRSVAYDAQNPEFNEFDFSDIVREITFDRTGTYSFRMTEEVGDLEDVDYDRSVNTFAVEVTDADMDGQLEIGKVTAAQNAEATEVNGEHVISVVFNNTFVPATPTPEDITVNVEVNKTVENMGASAIGPEGFQFVLEDVATGEKLMLQTSSDGKVIFDLDFTAGDVGRTYTYKLFEVNTGVKGVTYDATVHEISISISLGEDGQLDAMLKLNGSATDSLVTAFENIYEVENPVEPPTGDMENGGFWFIMMMISGAACVALIAQDRKYAR